MTTRPPAAVTTTNHTMENEMTPNDLAALRGKEIPVGPHGFIQLIDWMGGDEAIAEAARTSYGQGTKSVSSNRGLIRYLMRHRHTTPFEMCEIKLRVKAPMDVWRQWIRHRTANVNEYSTRYSIAIDDVATTKINEWRMQASDNKQGSGGMINLRDGELLTRAERELQRHARGVYDDRIKAGVAREQARKDLPLCTYTLAFWKNDLHNLLGFMSLRCDGHAQQEIREFADAIAQIVAAWCPIAFEAWQDFRYQAQTFTRLEMVVLQHVMRSNDAKGINAAHEFGWLTGKPHRERAECEAKIQSLGRIAPWVVPPVEQPETPALADAQMSGSADVEPGESNPFRIYGPAKCPALDTNCGWRGEGEGREKCENCGTYLQRDDDSAEGGD